MIGVNLNLKMLKVLSSDGVLGATQTSLVLVLLFQLVLVFPARVNQIVPIETMGGGAELDESLEQRMQGVHLVEAGADGQLWELWAEEAVAFKDRPVWEVYQTKVVFFGKDGAEFKVTGNVGEIDTSTKNITIRGNVVTHSSNGYTFRTVQVGFNASTRILDTTAEVDMDGPADRQGQGLRLTGQGMVADLKTGLMSIVKNVRAQRLISDGRTVLISSETAEFSSYHRRARFLGQVVMALDDMRVSGGVADFDYDMERKEIRTIDVSKGARISDQEKSATAKHLKINLDVDKYILSGRPRVMQGSDELQGERIVIEDRGRRVKVEKARAKVDEKSFEESP